MDAYGTLPDRVDFESQCNDDLGSGVVGLFLEHPPLSRVTWGSAVAARLVRLFSAFDEIHPTSEYAEIMRQIVEGVANATFERIAINEGWTEEKQETAILELYRRRRTRPCCECGASTPVRSWWCAPCYKRLDERWEESEP